MMKHFIFCCLFWVGFCAMAPSLFAQTVLLTGKVSDENGEVIVGASITVSGTTYGAITDINGEYRLKLPQGTYTINCSFTGYKEQKKSNIIVSGSTRLDFFMGPDTTLLEEVVVVGYGVSHKSHVTSSSYSIAKKGKKGRKNRVAERRQKKYEQERTKTLNRIANRGRIHRPDTIRPDLNGETYNRIIENAFLGVKENPLSTFSVDVDVASFANIRRLLNSGNKPIADAVRVEEMINYFDYQIPYKPNEHPFSVYTELANCPWKLENQLLMVQLQGKTTEQKQLPPSNFVFLVDVSGSMSSPDKLPLVQESLRLLTQQLRDTDRVAMVVYAGAAGLVLPSTRGNQKAAINEAIERLSAGGSTAGAAGIQLAYETARKHFTAEGNNRVILCTDGDFNVGVSSDAELVRIIEKEREHGIYLTVLGFGTGNYQDGKMQELADRGNGNHAYIDRREEAVKVLVKDFSGTLFTIAKDVKLQLEFNPVKVASYRLIGYENRLLAKEDFNDDTKDAGEIGAGHRVTALYEIVPVSGSVPAVAGTVDALKYQQIQTTTVATNSNDLVTVKIRYKKPVILSRSRLIEQVVPDSRVEAPSEAFQLASTVAAFGMLLRDSRYKGTATFESLFKTAQALSKQDEYKTELAQLIQKAGRISTNH